MRKKNHASVKELRPQIRGLLSTPMLRSDGKISAAWEDLRKGQTVRVYVGDVCHGSGEIDAKTTDSQIVWILHNDGQPRRLYSLEDGYQMVIQDPDPSLVQQNDRAITKGWF